MTEAVESRRALVRRTLQNAGSIPFYQEHWKGVLSHCSLEEVELTDLPLLSKSMYREAYMFDARSLAESTMVTHTSGTTGELTWRHRSSVEAGVIATVFEKLLPLAIERPLVLSVQYGRHGMGMSMPSNCDVFPIALSDETELLQAIAATRATFHIGASPRFPQALAGGIQHLALLAQARLDRGQGPQTSTIKQIHCMGYCDPAIRNFVRYAFNEPRFIEDFSMAEIFGSSTREWPHPYFRSTRHMVAEVLSSPERRPVSEGEVGELILTELFPFTIMQPLIRYCTGDIVRCISFSEEDGLEFDWLGRENDCPKLLSQNAKLEYAYFFRAVSDWLSLQPSVARTSRQPYLPISNCDYGPPCFLQRTSPDSKQLTLTVGVSFNPWLHRTASKQFSDEVIREVSGDWEEKRLLKTQLELELVHVSESIEDPLWMRSQPAYKVNV